MVESRRLRAFHLGWREELNRFHRKDNVGIGVLVAVIAVIVAIVAVIAMTARVCVEEGDCHDEIVYVTHKINKTTSISTPQYHRVCECLRYDGDPPRAKKRGM